MAWRPSFDNWTTRCVISGLTIAGAVGIAEWLYRGQSDDLDGIEYGWRVAPYLLSLLLFLSLARMISSTLNGHIRQEKIVAGSCPADYEEKLTRLHQLIGWRSTLSTLIAATFAAFLPVSIRIFSDFPVSQSGIQTAVIVMFISLVIGMIVALIVAFNFDDWKKDTKLSNFAFLCILILYTIAAFTAVQPASAFIDDPSAQTDPCLGFEITTMRWWHADADPETTRYYLRAEGYAPFIDGWVYAVFVVLPAREGSPEKIFYREPITEIDVTADGTNWRRDYISMTYGNEENVYFVAMEEQSPGALFTSYWKQLNNWAGACGVEYLEQGTPQVVDELPPAEFFFPESDNSFKHCDEVFPDGEAGTPTPDATGESSNYGKR